MMISFYKVLKKKVDLGFYGLGLRVPYCDFLI